MIVKSALVGLLVFSGAVPAVADSVSFPEGNTCVAWKTKKRMFLVKSVEPVGTSCDAKALWSRENGQSRVQIKVSVASFNSGETDRDSEVVKILKGETYPEIVITSELLTPNNVKDFTDGKDVEIKAEVEVGGRKVQKPFVVRRHASGGFARVEMKTMFKDFGIEPPTVAGGVVAKVSENLELHGQIAVPVEVLK